MLLKTGTLGSPEKKNVTNFTKTIGRKGSIRCKIKLLFSKVKKHT